jgi:hypothetical protein
VPQLYEQVSYSACKHGEHCSSLYFRHLIADHLSWFTENASEPKTIEQMIEAKGGKVQRGMQYVDGKGYETVEMFDMKVAYCL